MASIVETSTKKPLLIAVIFTVLTLGGFVCYNMLNLNLLPKFELPMMTVVTIYPGAGASEVETSVTKKIEDVSVNKTSATNLLNKSKQELLEKTNIPLSLLSIAHSCTESSFPCNKCKSCKKYYDFFYKYKKNLGYTNGK